jgi:O-antigen/teichoic acid export membrane protein
MSPITLQKSPYQTTFRRLSELSFANMVARIGTFAVFILLTVITRNLGTAKFALTFALLTVTQVLLTLDFGVGGLATSATSSGLSPAEALTQLRPLLRRSARAMGPLLVLVGIGEILVLSRLRGYPSRSLVSLIALQMGLLFWANRLVVYERLLFGAGRGFALAGASMWGMAGACSLLVISMVAPASLLPVFAIASTVTLVGFTRFRARAIVLSEAKNSETISQVGFEIDTTLARRFWILQLCALISFGVDQLVVSSFGSKDEAAAFAAHSRYFQIAAAVVSTIIMSMWPTIAGCLRDGLAVGARRIYFRATVLTICGSSLLCVPILTGWFPIDLLRKDQKSSEQLLIPMAIWFVLFNWGQLLNQVQAALEDLRFQVRIAMSMAAVNLVLSILFCWLFGPVGVVWGSLASYPAIVIVPVTRRLANIDAWHIKRHLQ